MAQGHPWPAPCIQAGSPGKRLGGQVQPGSPVREERLQEHLAHRGMCVLHEGGGFGLLVSEARDLGHGWPGEVPQRLPPLLQGCQCSALGVRHHQKGLLPQGAAVAGGPGEGALPRGGRGDAGWKQDGPRPGAGGDLPGREGVRGEQAVAVHGGLGQAGLPGVRALHRRGRRAAAERSPGGAEPTGAHICGSGSGARQASPVLCPLEAAPAGGPWTGVPSPALEGPGLPHWGPGLP